MRVDTGKGFLRLPFAEKEKTNMGHTLGEGRMAFKKKDRLLTN